MTQLLGIQHPILLAGMGQTSGAPLAAAVSNAGTKTFLAQAPMVHSSFRIPLLFLVSAWYYVYMY